MPTKLHELFQMGQSVWCDNLSRKMIGSEDRSIAGAGLRGMIELGIVGITSNPTIFMKSIAGGRDYDDRLTCAADGRRTIHEVYEQLVVPDIMAAADMLRPVFDQTDGVDGFVSFEVNPHLAHDTDATIAEARRLFEWIDRPNVFIKVPATAEGIPAIATLIADGIHVNVTLIFSLLVYEKVMRAYVDGLRRRTAAGGEVSRVRSVASFFISRVDTAIDKLLVDGAHREAAALSHLGKTAIANAKLAYARFEEYFGGKEFAELRSAGAAVQRPLWASTSTKNPAYPDTMYVDNLIGPQTVNTMPPETIVATLDHGRPAVTIRNGLSEARATLEGVAKCGVDLLAATDRLTHDGVRVFADSYDELMNVLRARIHELRPA